MRKFLGILAALCLISTPALAQSSRVWITEFTTVRPDAAAPFAQLPAAVRQPTLDISGGVSKRSAIFSPQTRYIRIVCEVQCAITATSVATVSDILLPALRPEYFGVAGGGIVNVIASP